VLVKNEWKPQILVGFDEGLRSALVDEGTYGDEGLEAQKDEKREMGSGQ